MNKEEVEQQLAEMISKGKTVTVTSKRGKPVWLGDSIGRIISIEGNTLTLRDRDRTMGGNAKSIISIDKIVAVREARPNDVTGTHNDR